MKRIYFLVCTLCVCLLASAQRIKKVETFDRNTWHWTEGTDQYHSATIEDGYLVISNLKKKKGFQVLLYQSMAKSFAKLPLRPQDNFRLTIKLLVADYKNTWFQIFFNTEKGCLMDENEEGQYGTNMFFRIGGQYWNLDIGDNQKHMGKFPRKVKSKGEYPMEFVINGALGSVVPRKSKGEYPMEFVIEKKGKNVSFEVDGVELYEGLFNYTNPCIGFLVPYINKKNSYIKVDEIIIEQADISNDD